MVLYGILKLQILGERTQSILTNIIKYMINAPEQRIDLRLESINTLI